MKKVSRTPLKQQIGAWVQSAIRKETFLEGEPIPSINALMAKFAVARETVRQALEDLVRQGILTPQHGRGFFVTARRKRILRIAMVARIDGVYLAPIYRGLVRELGNLATVLVADPQDNLNGLKELAESFAYTYHIDRLLLVPPRGKEEEFSAAIRPFRRSFGIAWIDRAPSQTTDACFLPDYPACVALAVNYFRSTGTRNVFYFSRSAEDRSVYSAMRNAFAGQFNRSLKRQIFLKTGKEAIDTIRSGKNGPTGILTENDVDAIHLLTHLTEAGFRIPDDVGLISCDNSKWTNEISPAITSVDPGFEALGAQAARWIIEELPDSNCTSHPGAYIAKPAIVIKGSTLTRA